MHGFYGARTEVSDGKLQKSPKIWDDFMHSRLPLPARFSSIQALADHKETLKAQYPHFDNVYRFLSGRKENGAPPVQENIQALGRSGTVAIAANFYTSLFGGPAFQILKCLTAIKICEELAEHNVTAVPVCWVSTEALPDFSTRSITLLDPQSELHKLELNGSEAADFLPPNRLPWNQISALLARMDSIGQATYDVEILEVLKSVFVPGTDFSSASALLISNLMSEWGMVVLNADAPDFEAAKDKTLAPILNPPGKTDAVIRKQAANLARAGYDGNPSGTAARTLFAQSSLLPMLGIVAGPFELYSYVTARPLLDEAGLPQPAIWPQPSVTITDSRRRRILARYNLGLHQLYSGEEEVIEEISNSIPCSAVSKLNDLKSKVDECIMELEALAPGRKKFTKKSALCREKILYQLEKLRRHYAGAREKREQTVNRQIRKACNLLAPNRCLQEREMAGIQILLRHSRAGLRVLYKKMDIMDEEHQLISMD